ncbi:MAG: hypothetical protein GY925_19735 [Actinomycetia bacterium]|nr:hypothetical protein [Actinomycetes bacterium]
MTLRAFLLVTVAVGWWRLPAAFGHGTGPGRRNIAIQSAIVAAIAVCMAWVSGPILDGLAVDTETFRIATGLTITALGMARVLGWGSRPEPVDVDAGVAGSLWPVAYPVLLGPSTVLAAVSVGSDHGVFLVLIAVASAALFAVVFSFLNGGGRWSGSLVRLGGVVLILLAVALVFDGLRDV